MNIFKSMLLAGVVAPLLVVGCDAPGTEVAEAEVDSPAAASGRNGW